MGKPRYVTFDAHVHVMTRSRLRSGWRWLHREYLHGQASLGKAPTPESLVANMTRVGLMGYFNFFFSIFPSTSWHVNEWNDGFCAAQPGAIPLLSIHPHDTPVERNRLVKEFLINRKFAGLKIHSYIQGIRLDSHWFPGICSLLEEHKRLLFLHTGFSHYYQSEYGEEEMAEHLAGLLDAFPKLPVVVAHLFYPRMDIAFRLLKRYPNLYLDITGIPGCLQKDGMVEKWMPLWELHAERMLFGSDSGLNTETLTDAVQQFVSLPLTESALKQIGGETACRIVSSLGISRRE